MRLRFWEPSDMHLGGSAGMTFMAPRRVNLTHLDRFGRQLATAAGAEGYTMTQAFFPQPPVTLDELPDLLPEELGVNMTATAPSVDGQPERSITATLNSSQCLVMCNPSDAFPDRLPWLVRFWDTLGDPRRSTAWRAPALFLGAMIVALVPVVVLLATGSLSPWLIPALLGLVAMAFYVASPQLQTKTRDVRLAESGMDLDLRPVQRVRLDREQHRQRRNVALVWGSIAAAVGAGVGAGATAWWT